MLARAAYALRHARRSLGAGDTQAVVLDQIPLGSTGAEVGVWKGDLSARLLERCSHLHLVDPWAFQPQHADSWYGGAEAVSQSDMDAIHRGVMDRFADEIATGRVAIHRLPSTEAARYVQDWSLDWVYIDGDHTYGGVVADLAAWVPKVRPGGLVMGDDYQSDGWWGDGVTRAVEEWAERERPARVLTGDHQFVFRVG